MNKEISYFNKDRERIVLTETQVDQLRSQFESMYAGEIVDNWLNAECDDSNPREAELKQWYQNMASDDDKECMIDEVVEALYEVFDGKTGSDIIFQVVKDNFIDWLVR